MLVHGHPFNRTMWSEQLRALSDDFRVIAPDLRGYGESPVTSDRVSMRQLADDVVELLDSLGVERAAIVGLSMGGLVAMELALAHPDRARALVLAATTHEPVTPSERDDRHAAADRLETAGPLPLAAEMIVRLFGEEGRRDPALLSRVFAMMVATPPQGAAAALRGRAERPDYSRLIGSIEVPCLVCVGDEDTYTPVAVAEELAGLLPDARLVTLAGIGHLPNLEAPAAFNEAVRAFLAENGEPSS